MTVFRIANHWLILIPAWWVGGLGDVLIQSVEVTKAIFGMNPWRILIILIPIVVMFRHKYPFKQNINAPTPALDKNATGNSN